MTSSIALPQHIDKLDLTLVIVTLFLVEFT